MVAKHGPADIDDFHRKQTEACQPRPIAIDIGIHQGFVAIDKIICWVQEGSNAHLWLTGRQHPLVIYDPERQIDNRLRELFQVVTP